MPLWLTYHIPSNSAKLKRKSFLFLAFMVKKFPCSQNCTQIIGICHPPWHAIFQPPENCIRENVSFFKLCKTSPFGIPSLESANIIFMKNAFFCYDLTQIALIKIWLLIQLLKLQLSFEKCLRYSNKFQVILRCLCAESHKISSHMPFSILDKQNFSSIHNKNYFSIHAILDDSCMTFGPPPPRPRPRGGRMV